ncbi:hypothetical protein B0H11DRAFT_2223182 [Mycena galericulata]|nr:hypothetical protein B0H11DRAFT_2223182 [Mycena galericulata]
MGAKTHAPSARPPSELETARLDSPFLLGLCTSLSYAVSGAFVAVALGGLGVETTASIRGSTRRRTRATWRRCTGIRAPLFYGSGPRDFGSRNYYARVCDVGGLCRDAPSTAILPSALQIRRPTLRNSSDAPSTAILLLEYLRVPLPMLRCLGSSDNEAPPTCTAILPLERRAAPLKLLIRSHAAPPMTIQPVPLGDRGAL